MLLISGLNQAQTGCQVELWARVGLELKKSGSSQVGLNIFAPLTTLLTSSNRIPCISMVVLNFNSLCEIIIFCVSYLMGPIAHRTISFCFDNTVLINYDNYVKCVF